MKFPGRRLALCLFAVLFWGALAVPPVMALIERVTPLSSVIKDSDYIVTAKVERLAPDKPGMVLAVIDDLQGKAPFRRLAVNLTGDKEKDSPKLLERLATDLPVVLFVTELNKKLLGLGYSNGTWFQIVGEPEGDNFRWSFTHCEPFLRRTFKGPTAEMATLVRDILAGKKKAPPVDTKELPGLGPKVENEASK
ncbi:MAG TPA: hypothetical protein VFE24_18405 [Pirellulales bacterium]|nr:hypothetical protein [Pirellulales bacterium]